MKELKDPPAPEPESNEPKAEMGGEEGLWLIVECGL